MNRINPDKLMNSKWTARQPQRRERHFIVTRLIRDEHEKVQACDLEAVISHQVYRVEWRKLKDSTDWLTGWK